MKVSNMYSNNGNQALVQFVVVALVLSNLLLSMISLLFSKSVVHQQDLHYRHIFESF